MKTYAMFFLFFSAICAWGDTTTSILQNNPKYSPFAYILNYISNSPGNPECYINEGYLNFLEDYYLNPDIVPTASSGTNDIHQWPYPLGNEQGSPDITLTLLTGINAIPNVGPNTYIAVSSSDCDGCSESKHYIQNALPTMPLANLHTNLSADTTHGKTLQCSNGTVYFTQNGSLNMQTVGETTKANNSLVFVEMGSLGNVPKMYAYFKGLWNAVVNDTGVSYFTNGTKDSSGLEGMNEPVTIGQRQVSFYAGRNNSFVGPTWSDGGLSITFPNNLYPPTQGEVNGDMKNVNWYDQILLDAGNQLAKENTVNIDIYMFEIGTINPFIDNLYRFLKYGFVASESSTNPVAISKIKDAKVPSSRFPGNLTVNLYYQYQDIPYCPGSTTNLCPTSTYNYLINPVVSGSQKYSMTVKKVWQGFRNSTFPGNPDTPDTPQDMHLKVDTVTYGNHVNLYVTSSNLDMPSVGSGKKWQAGNIIKITLNDKLYALYKQEFDSISTDGYLSQYRLGFINAQNNSFFDSGIAPQGQTISNSGIAAFIFPMNTTASTIPPSYSYLFNWAEQKYPLLFPTSGGKSLGTWGVYTYQYYPASNSYIGVSSSNNDVYYMGPDGILQDQGSLSQWLQLAYGCLFNWAETTYTALFPTSGGKSEGAGDGFIYRYYPANQSFLGVSSYDGNVYTMDAYGMMNSVGLYSQWLSTSGCQ